MNYTALFYECCRKKTYIHCKHFTGFPLLHRENLLLLRGKFVNVIGKPHNLFREIYVNITGIPYNIYNISLKEYGGVPVNYTALFYECCRKNPIYIANILRGSLCYIGKIFNWYGENL